MMDETNVKTNSFRAWALAARPKTLSGAAVPIMIGVALAWADAGGHIAWGAAGLCLLFAMTMQVDANLVNDYFDFRRGNDDAATRLGPPRACSMGWVSAHAMRRAIAIVTTVACIVGLPLAWMGGWPMVGVGVACVAFCFLYTTKLSYMGLGDALVIVFFGLVPVCLTYYLSLPPHERGVSAEVVVGAVACGLVTDTLLIVNNYRDIDNDIRDGKLTLVARIGPSAGRLLYLWVGVAAVILGVAYVAGGHAGGFVLPIVSYLWLHIGAYRRLRGMERDHKLNDLLGQTARNMIVYGMAVAAGVAISA